MRRFLVAGAVIGLLVIPLSHGCGRRSVSGPAQEPTSSPALTAPRREETPAPPPPLPTRATLDGQECKLPPVPPNYEDVGFRLDPFCVVWRDLRPNETGFLVRVEYLNSGEVFEHTVAPNVTEVILPDDEAPLLSDRARCRDRAVMRLDVFALSAAGREPVDGTAMTWECGGLGP
jgi:hypothetical protein